ncbi:hypothetical protein K7X08_008489 [Anisodus acutangulus]|uniref:pyruvate, phosphate dikinase n=1 Tax=Anisodus acutangulus TaxID=402998 RepID=A0A9Q1RQ15_9SOLA|nr:hypothetical protein K7X08_008489 [Anisodus acutangulus]
MNAASGILTPRGGVTSYAAVVARGWGKCCVSGCADIRVNESEKPLAPPAMSGDLEIFLSWADEIRHIKVMANANTPEDALTARNNGAEGIGLCRTEHMFFASDEMIKAVRRMIMAVTPEQRKEALDSLLPYQSSDFEDIFRKMDGISYPELTEMQARAILQAAITMNNQGISVFPEIMVPLVGTPQELNHQVCLIRHVAKKVFSEMRTSLNYKVGTMIEVPRAALIADEVLDQKGVGELIKIATERGRAARPDLKVGICGEHGGEPSSVAFFAEAGLDYVSCSPFRVPIARLAAAQVVV